MGFVTPIVHALTYEDYIIFMLDRLVNYFRIYFLIDDKFLLTKFNMQLTLKSSTWQVMLQSRKSRELTVNPYSCGSYDLI